MVCGFIISHAAVRETGEERPRHGLILIDDHTGPVLKLPGALPRTRYQGSEMMAGTMPGQPISLYRLTLMVRTTLEMGRPPAVVGIFCSFASRSSYCGSELSWSFGIMCTIL